MKLDLDHIYQYHAPTEEQRGKYEQLRSEAKILASIIEDVCPDGADKSAAHRLLREAVMTANASIALGGRLHLKTEIER